MTNVIRHISGSKGEPEWMLDIRLKAYQHFLDRPMPEWGADLGDHRFRRYLLLHQAIRA